MTLVLLTAGGCGDDPPRNPGREAPGARPLPAGTAAPGAEPPPRTRSALSAGLREALSDRDLPRAADLLARLEADHDGRFELPDGRVLARGAAQGAVLDGAVAAAREAVERLPADPAAAQRALAVAEGLPAAGADGGADPEELRALGAARRYCALARLGDLATPTAPHAGPRVLVVADDFDLGEPGVVPHLVRWARENRAGGLRVGVLPMFRGLVRVGMRRTRARDLDEERAAVARRLAHTGVDLEPEPTSAAAAAADLGLLGQDMAVLVFERGGGLVARRAGRGLDLAALDAAVERAASR